jgi:hypothetical protein
VLKATPVKVGENVKNTKVWSKPQISKNQVPMPFKSPSAGYKSENIQNVEFSPDYSNVKKASIAFNKSTVSAKISRFSSHDEKLTISKKAETHKNEEIKSSRKEVEKPKLLVTNSNHSKPSLATIDNSRYSSNEVQNSNSLTRKSSHSNSSVNKYENPNSSKSLLTNSNNQNPLLKKDGNSNSLNPAKKSVITSKVVKSSTESLNNHNQIHSNESPTKLKTQSGSVTKLVQNVKNQTRKSPETSKLNLTSATTLLLKPDSPVPSDQPTFVVHVDRSRDKKKVDVECVEEYYEIPESPENQNEMKSQNLEYFEPDQYEEFSNKENDKLSDIYAKYLQIIDDNDNSTRINRKVMFADEDDNEYEPIDRTDCQEKVKESPVISKATEKEDTKEKPEAVCDITIKNAKTSDSFVKNSTSYATVKTTKIASPALCSDPQKQPGKGLIHNLYSLALCLS